MAQYQDQYNQFQLTPEQCANFNSLEALRKGFSSSPSRVVMETIVVSKSERQTVKMEEQGGKLV